MHRPVSTPSSVRLQTGYRTDIGRLRTENQDMYGLFPRDRPSLFVVADGMGGHFGGAIASRLVVNSLIGYFSESSTETGHRLRCAVEAANAAVWSESNTYGHSRRMGSTCTALAFSGESVFLAHVGDSRAYRLDASGFEQLTEDHTVAAELRVSGLLTAEEAAHHPQRHVLTRVLGVRPEVDVDMNTLSPLGAGDRFLLCSDGLADIPLDEVQAIVSGYPPQEAADRLIERANELGGADNSTAIIISIETVV
jgi:PPM family protein phosphatase